MSTTKPEAPADGEAQDQMQHDTPAPVEAESTKIARRIKDPRAVSTTKALDAVRREVAAIATRVQGITDEVGPVLEELETAVQDTARTVSLSSNLLADQAGKITGLGLKVEEQNKVLVEVIEKVNWLTEATKIQADSITDLETKAPTAPQVFEAVHRLMQRVEAIGKEGTYNGGQSGRYKFRKVDDVMDAVGHAMRDVGLVMQTQVVSDPTYSTAQVPNRDGKLVEWTTCRVTMAYTFIDIRDGSRHTIEMPGEGRDSSDKATSKALAMAMKYALTQGLCIPLESDQDPDAERPTIEREAPAQRPAPQQQRAPQRAEQPPAQQQTQEQAPPDARSPQELARAAVNALRQPGLTEDQFGRIMDYIWAPANEAIGLSLVEVDGLRVIDVVNATAATFGLKPVGGS